MTDTPMTPDRDPSRREELLFMLLHGGARDETIAQRVVDLALAEARAEMKAEVDRLREALSDATDQVGFLERNTLPDLHRQIEHHKAGKARWRKRAETAEARVAELMGTPVDEAAELAEGAAELEAMRREHPAPCRVPDSPDCACPVTPEQALRIERDRPETRTTHDCTLPLVRRLDCGHCPHEVCQDCDRCPHTCECTP
ncbi:hypothetical protein OG402_33975 [Streptomyces anulatus]|uniref:hypothetical protein n=1 Tax=Streptomyces anulatus TaxID=1892 RepID=UPI0022502086|nr:hypothetical protein [Streptomyces anulatus]MCX4605478.1 hypothetical protein [Streptomyces anulatus]